MMPQQLQLYFFLSEISFLFWGFSSAQTTEFITFAPNVTDDACDCQCNTIVIGNVTKSVEQIEVEVRKLVEQLKINKAEISATARKKTSAKDYRPSAQSIGYVGIICLVASIGGIVLLDLDVIWRDIKFAKFTVREIANSSNESVIRETVIIDQNVSSENWDSAKPLNTDNINVENEKK